MTGNAAAVALFIGLSVSACSGSAAEDAPPSDSTPAAASETPSPTPSAATEAQVASVLAGYEKDWREVIDKAGECRFSLTMKDPGPLAEAERLSCYTREVTAGMTAQTAIRDLDALTMPDSLTSLVSETEAALQAAADVDLESLCGPPMSEIKDSRKCDRALGTRMWAHQQLDTALDKWSPYL
ncbi:MAG: hypothetical protein ACRDWY_14120 [Actinomycetes bacterium]